jgi:Zn ribbon nucleic-acid-binding protein
MRPTAITAYDNQICTRVIASRMSGGSCPACDRPGTLRVGQVAKNDKRDTVFCTQCGFRVALSLMSKEG